MGGYRVRHTHLLKALAPIGAGEIVAIKGGHIVTAATLQSLPQRLQNSEIQIADGFHLVARRRPLCRRLCGMNAGHAANVFI